MKTLTEYINESLIQEKYGSDIIAKYMNPYFKTYGSWGRGGYLLQWDKVKDSNLHEVTLDEAMKLYRKQKKSHYIIWVKKDSREGETMGLITWGTDVIAYDGRDYGMSTKACIDAYNWAHIYDVEGYEDLMQLGLQKLRREQKAGATAIMKADEILEQNKKRYELALADMHKGNNGEVVKIFNDTMAEYQNVTKNYIVKFSDILSTPGASAFEVMDKYNTLTRHITSFIDKLYSWNTHKDDKLHPDWAKDYYDRIKELANKISEMCTKMIEDQK